MTRPPATEGAGKRSSGPPPGPLPSPPGPLPTPLPDPFPDAKAQVTTMDEDGELPDRYARTSLWDRLVGGRDEEARDRLGRGWTAVTAQAPAWLSAADIDDAELTRRARDRLIEKSRAARDKHIESERARRAEYGSSYRMVPPPPVDTDPTPTTREIRAERRRAAMARCSGLGGALVMAPYVLLGAPWPIAATALVVAVVGGAGFLWMAGGQAVDDAAVGEELDAAAQADAPASEDDEPADGAPSVSLLKAGRASRDDGSDAARMTSTLNELLAEHRVDATVTGHIRGPAVTRYLLTLGTGVRGSKISALAGDIGRAAGCDHEPWIGTVPGDTRLAVELPNKVRDEVALGEVMRALDLSQAGPLTVGLGRDITGNALACDLTEMPHLLVGGATGAGKSVFLNALICSPLVRGVRPDELRLILIDPKKVELSAYKGIPHLQRPIITDAKRAVEALTWLAEEGGEMDRRYALLEVNGVKNIRGFNERAKAGRARGLDGGPCGPMPYLLVVIDELADLIIVSKEDVETHVVRTTQLARAAGIHLVVATQRPSVDVVTGLIKANMPSRLAFATSSVTDSRVVLDEPGAQCLLGRGDALYKPIGARSTTRFQAAMITDREIGRVVAACKNTAPAPAPEPAAAGQDSGDDLLARAARAVIDTQSGSVSELRRSLKIRHARAAQLMDELEQVGVVGPPDGNNPRRVLAQPGDLAAVLGRLTSTETTS